jgi:hypothetical protein
MLLSEEYSETALNSCRGGRLQNGDGDEWARGSTIPLSS